MPSCPKPFLRIQNFPPGLSILPISAHSDALERHLNHHHSQICVSAVPLTKMRVLQALPVVELLVTFRSQPKNSLV